MSNLKIIDYNPYKEVKRDFAELTDEDFVSAWGIAVRATNLLDYYMTKLAEFEKLMEEYELQAEAKKEEISLLKDPKSVANGKRHALQDKQVIELEELRLNAKLAVQSLKAVTKTLDNIHFLCKSCYELGNRKYRNTGG